MSTKLNSTRRQIQSQQVTCQVEPDCSAVSQLCHRRRKQRSEGCPDVPGPLRNEVDEAEAGQIRVRATFLILPGGEIQLEGYLAQSTWKSLVYPALWQRTSASFSLISYFSMEFLKLAVASAISKSSSFPATIGDKVDLDQSIWTLNNGIKRVPQSLRPLI
jgi:hypothetical protein